MSITQAQVLEALKRVKGPDLDKNIVDLDLVSEILIKDQRVYFSITVDPTRAGELEPLREAAAKVVSDLDGVAGVTAVLTAEAAGGSNSRSTNSGGSTPEHPRVAAARAAKAAPAQAAPAAAPQGGKQGQAIPGVRHLIAVASGKGGVGKSTTTVNLALGLQATGMKVGILDADIYGPSQPRLLGLAGRPQPREDGALEPMKAYGLKAMSMGFMVDEGTPIIWRGPMVVSALNQMLRQVNWGELDVILIDMPPGTGDVQLSIAQQVPLSGAVIVSTPQDLALIDARKGLAMFQRVDVPVLGIIENMSYFLCPHCGERSDIFGHGGAAKEAGKLGVPFLGGIPLHMDIRETSDRGQPIVATEPESEHAAIYRDLASRVWTEVQAADGTLIKPDLAPSGDGATLKVSYPGREAGELSAEMLRVMSPSAEVQGHSPSQRVTVGGKRNVKITNLEPVGSYAVRIRFSDGHNTGLYTWDYLEDLSREKGPRWSAYLAELKEKGLSRD
ncbi:MAG TPA: P-loop NTPase [Hyphomicrobiaceae bacterium]|nr:P-loop NTPase [Hyphomicrobiaceae bacterium]